MAFIESGFAPGGSYRERVRRGAYVSPSGTRIEFDAEDVSRRFTARGKAFEFPHINEAFVQRSGFGSRRYPMRCYFAGPQHDRLGAAFELALTEEGMGKLEHPLYGTIDVLPLGEIVRTNQMVLEQNQTVVEVTFWTSTGTPYPKRQRSSRNEIEAALRGFDVAAAQAFAASMDLSTAVHRANAKASIRRFLMDVESGLREASESVSSVRQRFADGHETVNRSLDVLVGQPLMLAQQIVGLVRAPARAIAGITARLDGFRDTAASIMASVLASPGASLAAGVVLAENTTKIANDFHAADLFTLALVSGAVESTLQNTYTTRREALESADDVAEQFEVAAAWRESGFRALEQIPTTSQQVDTGASYQQLHSAVSVTFGRLVEVSFSLFPERVIVTDRPRTVVDLAAELYGAVDNDTLDYLINTHDLVGTEILEVPRGRRIAYYTR